MTILHIGKGKPPILVRGKRRFKICSGRGVVEERSPSAMHLGDNV